MINEIPIYPIFYVTWVGVGCRNILAGLRALKLRPGLALKLEFPKIRGTFLGVPILRIIVLWGLYWGKIPNHSRSERESSTT